MRNIFVIAKRDMSAFFVSPLAYVVLVVWLLYQGITFYMLATFFASRQYTPGAVGMSPLTLFFGGTPFFYIPLFVLVPVLSMRLLAEERRSGSIELLLTAPVSDIEVILGKYLAALSFWGALWLPTLLYVIILAQYGDIDLGVVGACYLGIFGFGLYQMAIGLLMSTIASSQIVAASLTFLAIGSLFLVSMGEFVMEGKAQEICAYLSIWNHMEDFARGIVDTRYLVYDVSIAVFALFLAVRALEGRRYAG